MNIKATMSKEVEFVKLEPPGSDLEDEYDLETGTEVDDGQKSEMPNATKETRPVDILDIQWKDNQISGGLAVIDDKDAGIPYKTKRCSENGPRPFPCDFCGAVFPRINELRRHTKTHTAVPKHECSVCGKRFLEVGNLKNHIRLHTGDKPYRCAVPGCGKRFTQLGHLTSHRLSHTDDRPYTCWMCGKGFKAAKPLRLHMETHNDKTAPGKKCDICEKTYKTDRTLKRHLRSHTVGTSFPCDDCKETFPSKSALRTHNAAIHKKDDGKTREVHQCPVCKRKLCDRSTLKRHIGTHDRMIVVDVNTFACAICEKTFNDKRALQKHLLVHEELEMHECTVCNKRFRVRANLNRHRIVHTDLRPFSCDTCGRSFNMKDNLDRHRRTHDREESHAVATADGSYQCSLCPSSFTALSCLIQHRRSHAQRPQAQRPSFPCKLCRNVYSSYSALRKHILLHSGVRPYNCQVCGKGFSQSDNYKAHYRTHSGEKPYECPVCTQRFRFRSGLKQHLRAHDADGERGSAEIEAAIDEESLETVTVKMEIVDDNDTDVCGEQLECFDGISLTDSPLTMTEVSGNRKAIEEEEEEEDDGHEVDQLRGDASRNDTDDEVDVTPRNRGGDDFKQNGIDRDETRSEDGGNNGAETSNGNYENETAMVKVELVVDNNDDSDGSEDSYDGISRLQQ